MSVWTHINGAITFEAIIEHPKEVTIDQAVAMEVEKIKKALGPQPRLADNPSEERIADKQCTLPQGSEEPIAYEVVPVLRSRERHWLTDKVWYDQLRLVLVITGDMRDSGTNYSDWSNAWTADQTKGWCDKLLDILSKDLRYMLRQGCMQIETGLERNLVGVLPLNSHMDDEGSFKYEWKWSEK